METWPFPGQVPKPVIVGISGVTNSGKTTLSQRLLEAFPGSDVVHQDLFFRDINDPRHEHVQAVDHHNWDTFSAVDFEGMLKSVLHKYDELVAAPSHVTHSAPTPTPLPIRLLIVEGILVLNVPELCKLMELKYALTITNEECRKRRLTRNYDPPDVPGYFDAVVWPMHEKYSAELIEAQPEIKYFDGNLPVETISQQIISHIQDYCQKKAVRT